jgi:hypothetical protein
VTKNKTRIYHAIETGGLEKVVKRGEEKRRKRKNDS